MHQLISIHHLSVQGTTTPHSHRWPTEVHQAHWGLQRGPSQPRQGSRRYKHSATNPAATRANLRRLKEPRLTQSSWNFTTKKRVLHQTWSWNHLGLFDLKDMSVPLWSRESLQDLGIDRFGEISCGILYIVHRIEYIYIISYNMPDIHIYIYIRTRAILHGSFSPYPSLVEPQFTSTPRRLWRNKLSQQTAVLDDSWSSLIAGAPASSNK
jgi:hypothetical protein